MSDYSQLPEPDFIDRDPLQITQESTAYYEGQTGKVLHNGQPERLLVNNVAYRETVTRIDVQQAALQNLAAYAKGPALAHLGVLVGVEALDAAPARCTGQVVLTEAQGQDVAVPAETRVKAKDNAVFEVETAVTVPAGETTAEVTLVAQAAGVAGNGYLPGEIDGLLDPVPYVSTITSTTQTTGGADAQDDEGLRQAIIEAPETFAVAGPEDAYIALAKRAHQDIVAVAAVSTYPGVMVVYPLMSDGNPSQEVKDLVLAYLSDKYRRPMCDQVVVLSPTKVEYAIEADVTLYNWADQATALARINSVLEAHADKLRGGLGRAIVDSQISGLISNVYGVYKVVLNSPESRDLAANEWADCTAVTINIVGFVNG